MIKVNIKLPDGSTHTLDIPCIPRIGESMSLEGFQYEVTSVHYVQDNPSDPVEVKVFVLYR